MVVDIVSFFRQVCMHNIPPRHKHLRCLVAESSWPLLTTDRLVAGTAACDGSSCRKQLATLTTDPNGASMDLTAPVWT